MNAISESGSDKALVIHVITRFDKGGSAENTFLTVRDLDKSIYDVRMIYGLSQESQMGGAEYSAAEKNLSEAAAHGVILTALPELVRRIDPVKDLRTFFTLLRTFRKLKPLIIHTHTSKAGFLGRWAGYFARVPVIIHTPHGHVFWGYFNDRIASLFVILERMTTLITSRLVMLTELEKKDHLHYRIAPENKLTVIHSGVDFPAFNDDSVNPEAMRKRLSIPANAFVVGAVGRLAPVKGHCYLLEAMATLAPKMSNLICVLLGEGELHQELENMALTLGIRDRIRFLGWRDDVASVMSVFDIIALPSLNEGMGRVIVEAMALGKPVIASAVGGIPNLVIPHENGLLFQPGNAENLAKSIELLYHSDVLRGEMGGNGKMRSTPYASGLMIRKIETLYSEMTSYYCRLPHRRRKIQ